MPHMATSDGRVAGKGTVASSARDTARDRGAGADASGAAFAGAAPRRKYARHQEAAPHGASDGAFSRG
ncbi:hypothetical protein FHS42_000371 [Streptomyces zagrosensis]|uniref:Uncharacterized protein n=1 Tax=Streptomyces zagrosensis TaxID=1042984 RepID=A0A7W9Q498_9ACTN|nr:hypothetical protein [Streptomyces zagrosensis]